MLTDTYVEQSIKAKPGSDYYLKLVGCVAIMLLGVPLFLFVGGPGLALILLGIILLTTFMGDSNLEYEYSLTNGSVDIAAIYNASRRKEKFQFNMDDVTMVVPQGSNRIEMEKFVKKYDFTSHSKEAKSVSFVIEKDSKKTLVSLELNDKCMEHVKMYAKNKMYDL